MSVQDLMRRAELATPCSANWGEMSGDEKVRHCGQCDQNVYNISAMTDEEVLEQMLLLTAGKKVCMRFYRRADGSFLTKDCPVGLRRLQEKARHAAAWVAGGLSLLVSFASGSWLPAAAQAACDWPRKPRWQSKIQVTDASNQQTTFKIPPPPSVSVAPAPRDHRMGGMLKPSYSPEQQAALDQQIASLENQGKENTVAYADKLTFRALFSLSKQQYLQAYNYYQRAFAIFEKLPDAPSESARSCAMQLATVAKLLNDTQAERMWRTKAQAILDKNKADLESADPAKTYSVSP